MRRESRDVGRCLITAGVALVTLTASLGAQMQTLPTNDGGWKFSGDAASGRVDGRATLNLRTGTAEREGLTLADGTVAFDMKVIGTRSFVGVRLRTARDGTYEDVYFRPHKSGLPDAIQYDPSYRGVGTWQLYHGPGETSFAHYEPGRWQHVRIEIKGQQAAIFVGDAAKPQLVVPRLYTGLRSGGFGFWALQPGAGKDAPWTVSLANIEVRPGVTSYAFEPAPPEAPAPGIIRRWQLAPSRKGDATKITTLPQGLDASWTVADADPSGLLPIDKYLTRPRPGPALTFARIRIRADRARTVQLDLGYSDDATVFLDGQPLFTGRFSYSYNFPRRDALITPDQATLDLKLLPGTHDVVVALSDAFGGWGLMGRILDRDGIEVIEP